MSSKTPEHSIDARRVQNNQPVNDGLSVKKTALIIVIVIGCIAILWPKVFYPMMFGNPIPKQDLKNQNGPGALGCCDVVLDREKFLNDTPSEIGPQMYRKKLNLNTGEISLRQERPAHLHPEIYQAMRERGRAIPSTPTIIPIMDRKISPIPPRIIEGRSMRPPLGAGSLHQPQAKGNSMGFIMPLYTIGIIVFFGYTIMKIIFKKPLPNAPYGPAPTDPNFRKQVFGPENSRHIEDLNGTKLVVTAIQGLIDAADEELKLKENNVTSDTPKKSNELLITNHEVIFKGHPLLHKHENNKQSEDDKITETLIKTIYKEEVQQRKEGNTDRSVAVLGMEVTASCEGGHKWSGRPPTPIFLLHNEHSKDIDDDLQKPQSIYLEGTLAHESKILVSDAETKTEKVFDTDLNGSPEEPAVVLSSKMTLSLINLHSVADKENENNKNEIESPLADDIEIIGNDEK